MKTSNRFLPRPTTALLLAGTFLVAAWATNTSQAYTNYSGCASCHGDFRGSTSTKGTVFFNNKNHDMHRDAASMATACNLCHIGPDKTPVIIGKSTGTGNNTGIGCTGCHVAEGLRQHHNVNGVTECYDCHDAGEVSAPENVKPPYYGTVDTKANNPGNTVQVANTNENWSVGDFLGLDNDGNNLYDLADYVIGPYRILNVNREGNNMRVTWLTAGGRTNHVQAAGAMSGTYANVSPAIGIPGVGLATNSYVEVNAATNQTRFYRMNGSIPQP